LERNRQLKESNNIRIYFNSCVTLLADGGKRGFFEGITHCLNLPGWVCHSGCRVDAGNDSVAQSWRFVEYVHHCMHAASIADNLRPSFIRVPRLAKIWRVDRWLAGLLGCFHASYYRLCNFRQQKTIFILLKKSFARFAGMIQGSGHESKRRPSAIHL
jgi:hypothetical protein